MFDRNEQRLDPVLIAIAMLLIPALYVGSYLALVKPEDPGSIMGRGPWPRTATYRVGGDIAKTAFAPLNYADRKIRPHYWEFDFPF